MSLIDDIITIAKEEAARLDDSQKDVFWKCLSNAAAKLIRQPVAVKDPKPTAPAEMSASEAQRFETKVMPFGQYKQQRVEDVPVDYLEYVSDETDFIRDLRRYLKSSYFRGRMRRENHDA